MTQGTDVAELDTDQQALVASSEEAALALAAQQDAEEDDEPLITPILKIGQPLTKEVQDGLAESGEFINTLTNEPHGTFVEIIVAYYTKGRFASDKESGRAFSAFGNTIPEHWEPLVTEQFVGTPFTEYPEAEEVFREAVKNKERDWGHGPLVSTTHNFTGYLLVEDGEPEPVRLSLQRTNMPAVRKIKTLRKLKLHNKPWWDSVLSLSTEEEEWKGKKAFVIKPTDVKIVRPTTPQEKALASELAIAVAGGRTGGDDPAEAEAVADKPQEPSADGALAV